MTRKLSALLAGVALALAIGAPVASAGSGDWSQPPNCFGKQVVGFAQTYGGIANAAAAFGVTIREGHDIVLTDICGRSDGIVPTP